MKRLGFILLLVIVGCRLGSASRLVRAVSMSGTYYEVENPIGAKHIYIFDNVNDASFETWGGENAIWTELKTGDTHTNTSMYQSVQDGYCYSVKVGDSIETFVFIEYSKHRLTNLHPQIKLTCRQTTIDLGGLESIPYYTDSMNIATHQYDVQRELTPSIMVTYENQKWVENRWERQTIQDTVQGGGGQVFVLDSILCDTKFAFTELSFSEHLYDTPDSVGIDSTYEAVAVAHHQQYFITRRSGKNEKEGPFENQSLAHSAPLDILFESHPSEKADYYSWKISHGTDTIVTRNDKDMRYVFEDASESGPVTYMVNLLISNSEWSEDCNCHCRATAMDTITLNSSFILVPNVFTPNGDDVNDEFRVAYRSICEFHCWVFNRWQHLVYKWDDPTKGWDGTYNGQKAPDSAYLYIIEAVGCDGQKFKLKGMVNLLRGE